MRQIKFKNSRGQTLVGDFYYPQKKEFPLVIYCSGFLSSKKSPKVGLLKEALVPNGFGLFAFDFSGIGESEGKFEETTITKYMDDLTSAINAMKVKEVSLIGTSVGGYVALLVSARDKRVKSLALYSPASKFPHKKGVFTDEYVSLWKRRGSTIYVSAQNLQGKLNYSFYEDGLKHNDYLQFQRILVPALIFHGAKDNEIDIEDSKRLVNYIHDSRLVTLGGAGHNYTTKEIKLVIDKTVQFLKEHA